MNAFKSIRQGLMEMLDGAAGTEPGLFLFHDRVIDISGTHLDQGVQGLSAREVVNKVTEILREGRKLSPDQTKYLAALILHHTMANAIRLDDDHLRMTILPNSVLAKLEQNPSGIPSVFQKVR